MSKRIRDKVDIIGNNMPHILEWAKVRRPDTLDYLNTIIADPRYEASHLLLAIAYKAGRSSVVAELEGISITKLETEKLNKG